MSQPKTLCLFLPVIISNLDQRTCVELYSKLYYSNSWGSSQSMFSTAAAGQEAS